MTRISEFDPVFVHASPRSGSTYFFDVLRRNRSLMCFNEAIIDVFGYWKKKGTNSFAKRLKWDANHNFLQRHEFSEMIEAWDSVMHLYPMFPSFRDYAPENGTLSSELRSYLAGLLKYARALSKRPTLCETLSRCRAAAMRDAFGGFHVAQFRDPLSQFGSFYRQLPQAGEWYFLVFPAMEIGFGGKHPLYSMIPDAWRLPVMPWPADDATQRWLSKIEYLAIVASPKPDTIKRIFCWHMFSWILGNLAAMCYSDLILDIDKVHDDVDYRRSVADSLGSEIGVSLDFSDVKKFTRYYEFEAFDVKVVCEQVISAIEEVLRNGRLGIAVRSLGTGEPIRHPTATAALLFWKIRDSLAAMEATGERLYVSNADWKSVAERNQRIWFNPRLRVVGRRLYPLAEPIVRAARRSGIWS
jgi:hypothetical protein